MRALLICLLLVSCKKNHDYRAESLAYVAESVGDLSLKQVGFIADWNAQPEHRLHHFLWHAIRNGSAEMKDIKLVQLLLKQGWATPRPAVVDTQNFLNSPGRKNGSGEDFLFMHRRMLQELNKALSKAALPAVSGWKKIPSTTDPYWKHPNHKKSELPPSEKVIAALEQKFTSQSYLKSVTLAELGFDIEFSIHTHLHGIWSVPQSEKRPPIPLGQLEVTKTWKWKDPQFNYLQDPYSAAVNPYFWKLHGWVDDRIQDWLSVNGYARTGMGDNCKNDPKCYHWKGAWDGPQGHHGYDLHHVGMIDAWKVTLQDFVDHEKIKVLDDLTQHLDQFGTFAINPLPEDLSSQDAERMAKEILGSL